MAAVIFKCTCNVAIGISLPGHKKRILAHLPNAFGKVEASKGDTSSICSGEYDKPVPVYDSPVPAFAQSKETSSGYVNVTMEPQNKRSKDDVPPLPPKLRSRRSNDSLFGNGPFNNASTNQEAQTQRSDSPQSSPIETKTSLTDTQSNIVLADIQLVKSVQEGIYSNIVIPSSVSAQVEESGHSMKHRPTPKPRTTKQKEEKLKENTSAVPKPVPRPRSRQKSKEIENASLKHLTDDNSSLNSEPSSMSEDIEMETNIVYVQSGQEGGGTKLETKDQGWAAKLPDMKLLSSHPDEERVLYSEANADKPARLSITTAKPTSVPYFPEINPLENEPIELDFTGGFNSDDFDVNPIYAGAGEPMVTIRPEPDGADSPEVKNRSLENLTNGSKLDDSVMDNTKPKTCHYEIKSCSKFPETTSQENVYAQMGDPPNIYSEVPEHENVYSEMGEEAYGAMWEYSSMPVTPDISNQPKVSTPPTMQKIKSGASDKNANILPLPKKDTKQRLPSEKNENDSEFSLEEPTFAPPPLPRDFSKQAPVLPITPRPTYFQPTPLTLALQGQGKHKASETTNKKVETDPFMLLANSRADPPVKTTAAPFNVKDFDPLYRLEEERTDVYSKASVAPHVETTNVYSEAGETPHGSFDDTPIYEGMNYK